MKDWAILVFAAIGFLCWGLAFILLRKIRKRSKEEKEIEKIVNDPKKLKEKLEENGKIIDDGKELKFNVEIDKKSGKEVFAMKSVELHKETENPALESDANRKPLKKKRGKR